MDNLKYMKHHLFDILNLNYAFEEWTDDDVPEIYWIGELQEIPTGVENGYEESAFILTAFSRGKWIDVLTQKDAIKEHFPPIHGLRDNTNSGSIAVFYENSISVPTGEADKKRLQINLRIREWKKG